MNSLRIAFILFVGYLVTLLVGIMPRKIMASHSKCPWSEDTSREAPPMPSLDFTYCDHITQFRWVGHHPFGDHHAVVWSVLQQLGMNSEVRCLLSMRTWVTFFAIDDLAYKELTLEVLTTLVENQHVWVGIWMILYWFTCAIISTLWASLVSLFSWVCMMRSTHV